MREFLLRHLTRPIDTARELVNPRGVNVETNHREIASEIYGAAGARHSQDL